MSGIKPEARNKAGLSHEASSAVKPKSKTGEHGIVLDEMAQEQPKDKRRAQQDNQQTDKSKR